LREVHLLETLRHPNIITYHHAWLESAQFSSFGPKIPTLHILMQWAEGGSLDDYIDARLGRPAHPPTQDDDPSSDIHSRSARIRAFRAMQRAAPSEKQALRAKLNNNGHTWTAVHLLSAEEVLSIFGGIAAGLGFLHDKSILHLDLKPGNVLLTWDEVTLMYACSCLLFVLLTAWQPTCDALRLWYLPRHDANAAREEWQHRNPRV